MISDRGKLDYVLREPLVVTVHIAPWNYPLDIFCRSVAPALAAGNTCVVKPAEEISLVTLALTRLFQEEGIPAGVLNVIPGSGSVLGPPPSWASALSPMSPSALAADTKAAQEAFERAVARAPQVRECHNITGTVEYLLRVEAADLPAYKHWHTDVLGVLPQLRSITTFVAMGSPKDRA